MTIAVPDIWGALPTLATLAPLATLFGLFDSLLHGEVLRLFFMHKIQTQGIAYTGIVMALIMSFVSSAYVITKSIAATLSGFSYAATYRGGSLDWGNNKGIFEIVSVLMYHGWALTLTTFSLWYSFTLWATIEKREVDVRTEGKGGAIIDTVDAMKFFTLCMIVGITGLIGAFSLGDVATNFITWFDHWGLLTKIETDGDSYDGIDTDGTAATFDVTYHYLTLILGYTVFTTIAFGGNIFGLMYMNFNENLECDFGSVDDASKQDIIDVYNQIDSVKKCYELLPKIKKQMDFNKNGLIDKCESAMVIKHYGSSEEYAKKFAYRAGLLDIKADCDNMFDPMVYNQ